MNDAIKLSSKNFSLTSGLVNVYVITVAKNRNLLPKYNGYLSADEKEKASRFKFEIDKERFIIGRGVLRILSAAFLKKEAKQIEFVYGEYGKPTYAYNPRLKFNLSHSGDMIVIAFAEDVEVGIDVEFIKTDFDVLKLAKNFFSNTEIKALKKQSEEELSKAFFRCWTRKESFIKAEGSGLSFPLDKFAVSLENDEQAELLETQWNPNDKDNWQLFSFSPSQEYIAAIAIKGETQSFCVHNWDD